MKINNSQLMCLFSFLLCILLIFVEFPAVILADHLLSLELSLENSSNLVGLPENERNSLITQVQNKILEMARNDKIVKQTKRITDKIPAIDKYTNEIQHIGTDRNILKTIINNLDVLHKIKNENDKLKIKKVVIYKQDNGNITDIWNKLIFKKINNKYVDSTGFIEGIIKANRNEAINEAKLSKTGLFIDKKVSDKEEEWNILNIKKMIVKIAKHRNISVGKLMAKNKPLDIIDEIIFLKDYPLKGDDIVEVCLCGKDHCQNGCRELKLMKRNNFL